MAFADKKGFSYRVKDKKKNRDRKIGTNYYAHNFLPAAVEAKLRTEGKNTAHFDNPKGAMSNYFRPLKFHGDGQVGTFGRRGGLGSRFDAPVCETSIHATTQPRNHATTQPRNRATSRPPP